MDDYTGMAVGMRLDDLANAFTRLEIKVRELEARVIALEGALKKVNELTAREESI